MDETAVVSVFCLTYNHESYIRDALEGFVSQKTNFKFEVLIHDDASTDGTAAIIREYEERYPDIIKPIYQTENQYSKHVDNTRSFLLPQAKGKYFAFCEGDDYWIDPLKLQKQFDFMEAHPEYTLCTHRAVYNNFALQKSHIYPNQLTDRSYSSDEVIAYGGNYMATASIFLRREAYIGMPDCFTACGFGDWQTVIYGTICGGCYCLQDVMSVYNSRRKGSYTGEREKDSDLRLQFNREALNMSKRVDEYYGHKYHKAFLSRIRYHEYHLYKHLGEWEKIQGEEYSEFWLIDQMRKKMKEE